MARGAIVMTGDANGADPVDKPAGCGLASAGRLRGAQAKLSLSKLVLSIPAERAGFAISRLSQAAALYFPKMDRIGLHYILEGEVDVEHAGGATERLRAGDFVCFARGCPHVIAGTMARGDPLRSDWLGSLEPDDVPLSLRFGQTVAPGAVILSGSIAARHTAADYTIPVLPECLVLRAGSDRTASFAPPAPWRMALEGVGASAFASAIMQALLVQAVRRAILEGDTASVADLHIFRFPKIAAAHRLIERNYQEPWTVSKLASAVGMSRSSFVAAFANVLGESPAARLTRIRLIEARRLLGGERAMRDVAANVGYRSQAAFNRAFRRQYGETPTAVRRAIRGSLTPHGRA